MRWVLIVALALRSLLAIAGYIRTPDVTGFHTPDTASYLIPAHELISHQRFYNNGLPEIVRTPGYPLLLTAGILVGHVEVVTVAIQILLNCFTVWMVYLTTLSLFTSARAGVLAATLYAIDPLSIFFTSMLVSDTLFTAAVMIWVYYLVRYLRRRSRADLIASGTALAASVYIRPSGYFLPLVIAGALAAWTLLTQARRWRRLAEIATYLMIIAALTVPWQLRNWIETGYAGFSGIYSENLYFYSAASVLTVEQHVPFYVIQERLGYSDESAYFEEHPEQRTWLLARRLDYMRSEGARIILGNPFLYARIHLAGVIRAALDPGATDYLKFFDLYPKEGGLLGPLTDGGLAVTIKGLLAAHPLVFWSNAILFPWQIMCLGCVGIALLSRWPIRDSAIIAMLAIIGYFLIAGGGPAGLGRFRLAAMPLICILAGDGLGAALEWIGLLSLGRRCQAAAPRRREGVIPSD